jgi:tetratricopeptide (TPR) repeat protein
MTTRAQAAASTRRKVLEIREAQLGPEHIEVANALNNLGNYHRNRAEYAVAESLYARALAILRRRLSNPSTPQWPARC